MCPTALKHHGRLQIYDELFLVSKKVLQLFDYTYYLPFDCGLYSARQVDRTKIRGYTRLIRGIATCGRIERSCEDVRIEAN